MSEHKYKVSICMIVKNEEANLQRCLDSFLPIIAMKDDETLEPRAELIIVDTGSTDRSVNVAKKYTDKVYEKEFIPWNFSDARNYGILKAEGEWILIVDADEELTQSSIYILMEAIHSPQFDEIKTMFFKLHNFYSIQTNEYAEVTQARLFRNTGEPLYQFAIHNKPRVDTPYFFAENVILNHYGYLFQKVDLFIEKKERSLTLLEEEYEKNPDDMHILTHIIKTYYATSDFDKVATMGDRWMELMRDVEYHEGWFAYLEVFGNLLGAYIQSNDLKNAERVMKESLKYSDKLISMYLLMGQFYLSRKKQEKARELFEQALQVFTQERSPYEKLCSSNSAVIMPEILNLLAAMEFEDGNFEKSGKYLNDGIVMNANRLPLRWDIFNEPKASSRLVKNKDMRKRTR